MADRPVPKNFDPFPTQPIGATRVDFAEQVGAASDAPGELGSPTRPDQATRGSASQSLEQDSERGPWMQTFTGKRFHLLDPRPEDVDIADIAHALAMLCRYNGHCPYFYSVAEHSVACAREAQRRGASPGEQLAVLLHDAAEAYTGDLISPVKIVLRTLYPGTTSEVKQACYRFDFMTYGIDQAIIEALPLPKPRDMGIEEMTRLANLLRAVDLAVGAAECLCFRIAITPGREQDAAPDWQLFFWPPELAEKKFLEMYNQLSAEVGS